MATYKQIFGKQVKFLSSDPANEAEGQVWYNSTSGTFKSVLVSEAWSSGSPLVEANYGAGGAGTQTAMLYFGGAPYPARTNKTFEYNGSGWTTGGNYIGTVNYIGGCGTQTAGFGAGGFTGTATPQASAKYNGTAWTSGNTMTQQRMNTGSTYVGIQDAAVLVGGDQYPSTPRSLSTCEEFDGTNFSSGGAYPVVIQNSANAGTQTAGWAAGGLSDPAPGTPNTDQSATNHYNGTSWTAGGALPSAVLRAGAAGTQTAGLFFSGGPPNTTNTFGYDGTSWAAKPSMATARQSIAAGGVSSTSTAAIGAGGYVTPGVTASTEEFNRSENVTTPATWAALPALGTARYGVGMGYVDNANTLGGMCVGSAPYRSGLTENYDGSSWTASGAMGTARYRVSGGGTQTAGIGYGGYIPGPSAPTNYQTGCEEYDGSVWTGGTALPTAAQFGAGNGPQTAAMYTAFNEVPGNSSITRLYDGGTWTTGGTLSTARRQASLIGNAATQTAALLAGGYTSSNVDSVESYDGSTWTASPSILVASHGMGNAGVQADALVFCGADFTSGNVRWNDTAWVTDASITNARVVGAGGSAGGAATASNAMAIGGNPVTTNVEQYSGETTALNYKTITTS